jgi:hypothetical protein
MGTVSPANNYDLPDPSGISPLKLASESALNHNWRIQNGLLQAVRARDV